MAGKVMDAVLARLKEGPATINQLISAAYDHREDGGPDTADMSVRQALHRLRHQHGARIEVERTFNLAKGSI